MKKINWTNVIECHEEPLKQALKKAFCDAVDYLDMEFMVEVTNFSYSTTPF